MVNELLAWYEIQKFWRDLFQCKCLTVRDLDFPSWQLGYIRGVQTTTNKIALSLRELREKDEDFNGIHKDILQWAKCEISEQISVLELQNKDRIMKVMPLLI